MDWPQNFILTGNQKTRPSSDDLNITQWVSGFVRCIQEEKSEAHRACMLDYLGNIMEDASNFSWESAKAAHAILLTNMEADRLNWSETDKIDHVRVVPCPKTHSRCPELCHTLSSQKIKKYWGEKWSDM